MVFLHLLHVPDETRRPVDDCRLFRGVEPSDVVAPLTAQRRKVLENTARGLGTAGVFFIGRVDRRGLHPDIGKTTSKLTKLKKKKSGLRGVFGVRNGIFFGTVTGLVSVRSAVGCGPLPRVSSFDFSLRNY